MNIVKHSDGLVIGSYKHVIVDVLRGSPGVEALEHVIERTRQVAKAYPNGQAILNILESSAFLPTPQERKTLGAKIKELESTTKATNMLIIEAKGFGAVAFRAVIAGLSFLAGNAQKVYASVDDAVAAVAKDLPVAEKANFVKELGELVQAVRKA
ncbi:MAG: hypothetical protein HY901_33715 [Deltaproteobacteria bacterium]|nr:hypothetical protein [Deltaproteobacteria bacterium]